MASRFEALRDGVIASVFTSYGATIESLADDGTLIGSCKGQVWFTDATQPRTQPGIGDMPVITPINIMVLEKDLNLFPDGARIRFYNQAYTVMRTIPIGADVVICYQIVVNP